MGVPGWIAATVLWVLIRLFGVISQLFLVFIEKLFRRRRFVFNILLGSYAHFLCSSLIRSIFFVFEAWLARLYRMTRDRRIRGVGAVSDFFFSK
jgi:hypothetical protein